MLRLWANVFIINYYRCFTVVVFAKNSIRSILYRPDFSNLESKIKRGSTVEMKRRLLRKLEMEFANDATFERISNPCLVSKNKKMQSEFISLGGNFCTYLFHFFGLSFEVRLVKIDRKIN